jgi:hypothetical protein
MRRAVAFVAVLLAAVATAGSSAAAPAPKLAGCVPGTPATVRPKKVIVACGDANFYFTNLAWSSWNAKHAIGNGIANVNDCTPTCAAGHFHTYRATLTLTRPRSCSNGLREFTRMAWLLHASPPAGIKPKGSQALPCR